MPSDLLPSGRPATCCWVMDGIVDAVGKPDLEHYRRDPPIRRARFCEAPRSTKSPNYCETHHEIAYPPRKDRVHASQR